MFVQSVDKHCHKVATECPGGGLARDCEAAGGCRVFLSSHMKVLWEKVGFTPSSFELNFDEQSSENKDVDVPLLDAAQFPNKQARAEPSVRDLQLSDGLTVKNIPKHVEDKKIFEYLFQNGLPGDHGIDQIRVNKGERNTWVVIEGLDANSVQTLYKNIHFPVSQNKFCGMPIYCNPLRNTTPQKGSSSDKEEIVSIPVCQKNNRREHSKWQNRDIRNWRILRILILSRNLFLKIPIY